MENEHFWTAGIMPVPKSPFDSLPDEVLMMIVKKACHVLDDSPDNIYSIVSAISNISKRFRRLLADKSITLFLKWESLWNVQLEVSRVQSA